MIYESDKKVYDKTNKCYLSEWQLNTDYDNLVLVTHIHPETLKAETRKFFADYVWYHLRYSEEHIPERIPKLVNSGKILEYLNEFDDKVFDAIDRQTELFTANSKEFQAANESGDVVTAGNIYNMCTEQAKEVVYPAMVYC